MAMRDIDFIYSMPVALGFAKNHATPPLLVNPRDQKPIVLRVAAKVQGDPIADCDPVRQPHVVIGSTGGGNDPTAAFGQYPKAARHDGGNIVKTSERRRGNGNSESKSNPQTTYRTPNAKLLPMIPVPSGVRVWPAVGRTDMRKGMNGLALQVLHVLDRDPHAGDFYVFRGVRGDLIKIVWHDGIGMSLYAKRLERGRLSVKRRTAP